MHTLCYSLQFRSIEDVATLNIIKTLILHIKIKVGTQMAGTVCAVGRAAIS